MRRVVLASSLCLLLASAPLEAAAAEPGSPTPLEIEVRSTPGCPSREDLARDLLARTSLVRLARVGEASARVEATLDLTTGNARGELTVRALDGSTSRREVRGDTCDEVARALVLFAALAFDPNAATAPAGSAVTPPLQPLPVDPRRAEPPPVAAPRSELPSSGANPPSPLARPLPRFRVAFGGTLGFGFGVAKGALAGGGGFVELTRRRRSVLSPSARLGFEHAVSPTVHAAAGTADFTRTIALLEACPLRASLERIDLAACVDGELGALSAVSADVPAAKSATRAWVGLGLGARAALPIAGPVFADMGLAALVAVTRDEFIFDPSIPVSKAAPIGLRTTLGLGVALP